MEKVRPGLEMNTLPAPRQVSLFGGFRPDSAPIRGLNCHFLKSTSDPVIDGNSPWGMSIIQLDDNDSEQNESH
jgi:hypothetical protein